MRSMIKGNANIVQYGGKKNIINHLKKKTKKREKNGQRKKEQRDKKKRKKRMDFLISLVKRKSTFCKFKSWVVILCVVMIS